MGPRASSGLSPHSGQTIREESGLKAGGALTTGSCEDKGPFDTSRTAVLNPHMNY